MTDKIALRMMRCPKCGSKHIDAFENAYWFMCRDCGYNAMPSSDETTAINNFLGFNYQELFGQEDDDS